MGTELVGGVILAWLALDFIVLPMATTAFRKLRGQS
jgi:hypothetical protein